MKKGLVWASFSHSASVKQHRPFPQGRLASQGFLIKSTATAQRSSDFTRLLKSLRKENSHRPASHLQLTHSLHLWSSFNKSLGASCEMIRSSGQFKDVRIISVPSVLVHFKSECRNDAAGSQICRYCRHFCRCLFGESRSSFSAVCPSMLKRAAAFIWH